MFSQPCAKNVELGVIFQQTKIETELPGFTFCLWLLVTYIYLPCIILLFLLSLLERITQKLFKTILLFFFYFSAGYILGLTSAPLSTFMTKSSFHNRYFAPNSRFLYFLEFLATWDAFQVVFQVSLHHSSWSHNYRNYFCTSSSPKLFNIMF